MRESPRAPLTVPEEAVYGCGSGTSNQLCVGNEKIIPEPIYLFNSLLQKPLQSNETTYSGPK